MFDRTTSVSQQCLHLRSISFSCKNIKRGGGGSLVVVVASAIVHTENLVVTAIDALPLLQ